MNCQQHSEDSFLILKNTIFGLETWFKEIASLSFCCLFWCGLLVFPLLSIFNQVSLTWFYWGAAKAVVSSWDDLIASKGRWWKKIISGKEAKQVLKKSACQRWLQSWNRLAAFLLRDFSLTRPCSWGGHLQQGPPAGFAECLWFYLLVWPQLLMAIQGPLLIIVPGTSWRTTPKPPSPASVGVMGRKRQHKGQLFMRAFLPVWNATVCKPEEPLVWHSRVLQRPSPFVVKRNGFFPFVEQLSSGGCPSHACAMGVGQEVRMMSWGFCSREREAGTCLVEGPGQPQEQISGLFFYVNVEQK